MSVLIREMQQGHRATLSGIGVNGRKISKVNNCIRTAMCCLGSTTRYGTQIFLIPGIERHPPVVITCSFNPNTQVWLLLQGSYSQCYVNPVALFKLQLHVWRIFSTNKPDESASMFCLTAVKDLPMALEAFCLVESAYKTAGFLNKIKKAT